jgi:hypothetical protein
MIRKVEYLRMGAMEFESLVGSSASKSISQKVVDDNSFLDLTEALAEKGDADEKVVITEKAGNEQVAITEKAGNAAKVQKEQQAGQGETRLPKVSQYESIKDAAQQKKADEVQRAKADMLEELQNAAGYYDENGE